MHQFEQLVQRVAQQVFLHGADVVVVNGNLALCAGIQAAGRDAEQLHQRRMAGRGHLLLRLCKQRIQAGQRGVELEELFFVFVQQHQAAIVAQTVVQFGAQYDVGVAVVAAAQYRAHVGFDAGQREAVQQVADGIHGTQPAFHIGHHELGHTHATEVVGGFEHIRHGAGNQGKQSAGMDFLCHHIPCLRLVEVGQGRVDGVVRRGGRPHRFDVHQGFQAAFGNGFFG